MSSLLSLRDRIYIFLIAVLAIGVVGLLFYGQHQNALQLQAIQTQVIATQQLADNINRAQSSWATKDDLTAFAQQNDINLGVIQKNLETLNASLVAISHTSANSSGEKASNLPSTSSNPTPNTSEPSSTATCNGQQIPCTNPDKYGYLSNTKTLQLNETFPATADGGISSIVPIGSVDFSASQQNPWGVNLLPRSYNLTTVLGVKNDASGQQMAYNQLTINVGGRDYSVPLSKNIFLQQTPTPKFSFWNPRLFLGADTGLNVSNLPLKGEFTPAVSIGLMSYGTSLTQPDWSMLQVGAGYGVVSKTAQLSVVPFAFNVGQVAKPLINNLYLGPSLDIGTNGGVTVGAAFRVGL